MGSRDLVPMPEKCASQGSVHKPPPLGATAARAYNKTKAAPARFAYGGVVMIKVLTISVAVVTAVPCYSQEVRVISGAIEHVYGPGGQLLDDGDLQARNQRASEQAEKLSIERKKTEAESPQASGGETPAYVPYSDAVGWWDTRGTFRRGRMGDVRR